MQFKKSLVRSALSFALVATMSAFVSQSVSAQYETSFSYTNPRTGFSYSQNVGAGNSSAYSSFSVSNRGRSHSAGSAYSGTNYLQHQYHQSPNMTYQSSSQFGRGYYRGGASVRRN